MFELRLTYLSVEHWTSVHEVLGSIPNIAKIKNNLKKIGIIAKCIARFLKLLITKKYFISLNILLLSLTRIYTYMYVHTCN
jgi:hypothetical protein